jgi:small-conductance mechanosensitive channel
MILKKSITFLFLVIVFQTIFANPQDKDENKLILNSGDTITIQVLKLSEISSQIEEISIILNKLDSKLKDNSEIEETDSIVTQRKLQIEAEQKTTTGRIDELSTRDFEDLEIRWNLYNKEFKSYQKKLNNKTKYLQTENDFLMTSLKTWELTRKNIEDQNGPSETMARITNEISEVKEYLKKTRSKLNKISKIQNKLTDLILLSEKILSELATRHLNWQSEFLRKDSPAIWALFATSKPDTINPDTTEYGSAITDTIQKEKKVSLSVVENSQSIKKYFSNKTDRLYIQLLILVILIFVFYKFHKKLQGTEISGQDERMQSVRFFTKYYYLSAWMFTVLISIWIFPDRSRPVNELIVFLLLIPSFFLYERLLSNKLRIYIVPIIVLFVLDKAQLFVDLSGSSIRILLLLKSLVTIWFLYIINNPNKRIRKELQGKWWDFVFKTSYIFLTVSLISFFANIFGYFNLAMLLGSVVTYGILIGILLSLEIGIAISFLIMLFQTKFLRGLNLVKNHQELIEKRVSLFLRLFALFLWLRSISTSLGIRIIIANWFGSIKESSMNIGSVSVSFGGIINFFIIVIVTSIIAKIIRAVLEEEFFPRIELPRGVPGAISMMVRYFIIGWGLYIALESAGIDLSSFGLLAGALGVGIGFGLQNIVANFISGLILAFERPIQTGDTIEVGTLMGDVKSIGVRASTIQTFDGSEVIVPNSNLITHEVINWTLSDRKRRRDIAVSAAYGTNPRKVLEIIKEIAAEHPSVIKNPGPWATFEGFGESSLNFKVRFWVSFDIGLTVKSEVAMNIYDAFEKAGIRIPFPQQDLHIKSFDPTVQKTIFPRARKKKDDDK